jgi:heme/copper-type cytochrome/quinol oxidase subunit 3
VFTAGFFLFLTVKLVVPAFVCGGIAIAALVRWLWSLDPGPTHPPVDIGGGIRLPVYVSGPTSQSWWAMVVLILVSASIYGCAVFSYLFLWTVSPEVWHEAPALPHVGYPLTAAILLVSGSACIGLANRALRRNATYGFYGALLAAVALLGGSFAVDLSAHLGAGLRPGGSAYGAAVFLLVSLHGFYASIVIMMALFTLARRVAGKLDDVRRVTFDNTRLFWHYTVAQSLVGLVLAHGFPRLLA